MTKIETGQFALGMIVSLVLSAIAGAVGFVAALLSYFAGGHPLTLLAVLLVPGVLAITWPLVRRNRSRRLGALASYPCAALVIFAGYQLTIGREARAERAAAQLDFSSRTIAQPLGTIEVLGIPYPARCIDTCARILLNGVANEVAGVLYNEVVDLKDARSSNREGAPWVFRRYRLGRGAECLATPIVTDGQGFAFTGADIQWIQSNGVYDVCILMSVGGPGLGDMILIDHGRKAFRPHGPRSGPSDGAAVALRIVGGQRREIARWEFGYFARAGLLAPGAPFTLWDFAKALSGKGEPDRLEKPYAIGLPAAIDRISASLATMPNLDGWAPFEFLRKVHEAETGRDKRRLALDPAEAARLRQLPAQICPMQNWRMVPHQCFERYNEVVDKIFAAEAAADLRWPL
jgi:hypothetical protein